jgi:hypothetical protein
MGGAKSSYIRNSPLEVIWHKGAMYHGEKVKTMLGLMKNQNAQAGFYALQWSLLIH